MGHWMDEVLHIHQNISVYIALFLWVKILGTLCLCMAKEGMDQILCAQAWVFSCATNTDPHVHYLWLLKPRGDAEANVLFTEIHRIYIVMYTSWCHVPKLILYTRPEAVNANAIHRSIYKCIIHFPAIQHERNTAHRFRSSYLYNKATCKCGWSWIWMTLHAQLIMVYFLNAIECISLLGDANDPNVLNRLLPWFMQSYQIGISLATQQFNLVQGFNSLAGLRLGWLKGANFESCSCHEQSVVTALEFERDP